MNTPVTQIVMVGPTRVGKTSLLAAMYNELHNEMRSHGCEFDMEPGPTQVAINEKLDALQKSANGNGMVVQEEEGIIGDKSESRFRFHIDVGDGGEPESTLEFIDLPGAWYTGIGDFKKADEVLAKSHVSFLAVDATALMELPEGEPGIGRYHTLINKPNFIAQAYQRAIKNHQFCEGHTVVLTLIRAESYIAAGEVDSMIRTAQTAYKDLAELLKRKNINLYGCYVETVGSLYINRLIKVEAGVSAEFRRDPKKKYTPQRCAIPLRIAAQTAMKQALDSAFLEMMKRDGFWARIISIFGEPEALRKARAKYRRVYDAVDSLKKSISEKDYFRFN